MTLRYLIYTTEAAATAANDAISARGVALAALRGQTIIDGAVVPQRAGSDDLSAPRVSTWSPPEQRADGDWCVLHPEKHPAADNYPWYLDFALRGTVPESLTGVLVDPASGHDATSTIETQETSWGI